MAKNTPSKTRKTIYRSAKTGRFTTKKYAVKHPSSTVKETRSTNGTGPKRK
jgi:hypothetical protein